jgi:hypothetical protein
MFLPYTLAGDVAKKVDTDNERCLFSPLKKATRQPIGGSAMTMTTPAEITDEIRRFCQDLVSGTAPIWVDFEPSDTGEVDQCFNNVAALVRSRRGQTLLGWTIWEWPGVLLEAVFHAVWEGDDGQLADPTPKVDGEARTLFLPDRSAIDDGSVVLGRHKPLCDWQEVTEYMDVCRQIGEAQRQYFPIHGGVPLEVWGPLLRSKEDISALISRRQEEQLARNGLLTGLTLSEADAAARFLTSPADVEASTVLARCLAARGDFGSAFGTLLRTAALDQRGAAEVRETFLQLFKACENQEMVNDYRRQFTMLLY